MLDGELSWMRIGVHWMELVQVESCMLVISEGWVLSSTCIYLLNLRPLLALITHFDVIKFIVCGYGFTKFGSFYNVPF